MKREKRHLILIGMMGSGKTTVGQALAERLGLEWKDTDRELERKWGHSIAEHFTRFGERAFREEETAILSDLLASPPLLLTTGGGIVLRKENRELMKRNGWVIHLYAEPEEIVRRLQRAGHEERPLLQGDLREKVWEIVQARQGKYDFADLIVDTTERSVSEIAEEIVSFWHSRRLKEDAAGQAIG
jgi:shikimate kinase